MKVREYKENEYEVTVHVDGMQYSEIGTLTISATTSREALAWVKRNMRLEVNRV